LTPEKQNETVNVDAYSENGPTLWCYSLSFWLMKKNDHFQLTKLPQSQILQVLEIKVNVFQTLVFQN